MNGSRLITLPGLSRIELQFEVAVLKPQPKERPLVIFRHGRARGVSRRRTVEEETRIVLYARAAAKRHKVRGLTGPIRLEVWCYRQWVKSIPVSRRDPETVLPATAPDLQNYVMLAADALEKSGLIVSDGAICDLRAFKRYRDRGGWLISVSGEPLQSGKG